MSGAAARLLRALLARAGPEGDRILLSAVHSVEWQSLTFAGERHLLTLRINAPNAKEIANCFTTDLGDHEFAIRGEIVADINCAGVVAGEDGSVELAIEALTIRE